MLCDRATADCLSNGLHVRMARCVDRDLSDGADNAYCTIQNAALLQEDAAIDVQSGVGVNPIRGQVIQWPTRLREAAGGR